jgi:hypothetical protein
MTEKYPDFWYIIGMDYEVVVFNTLQDARDALVSWVGEEEAGELPVFEGWYGKQFSGWIGRHDEPEA